jgi:hypothetical protein
LAPAWLPTHPRPYSGPPPDTASAALVASGTSAEQQPTAAATPTFQTFTFVAAQQSLLSEMLSTAGSPKLRIKSPHYSIRDSLQHLCDGTGAYDFPDMVELGRRLTVEEYRVCTSHGPSAIVEQQLGYQAVLLARGTLYSPLRLTARDVFLALARRVPDPSQPGELIDNHYFTWNEVDPALPYQPIQLFGPSPESVAGRLAAELLLTAGCNTYQWIAALRDTDEGRYSEICQTLRSDRVYKTNSSESDWEFAQALVAEPTAIGIFTLSKFESFTEKLVVNPVDGATPDMNTLASGTYPLARTLYLYLDKNRLSANYWATDSLVLSLTSPPSHSWGGKRSSAFWAFVPLDPAEQDALRWDHRRRLKALQF